MYEYTWYQWILFFYLYCFCGWVFESAYVSLMERRLVNRGFLRLPLLPLYGTGAVMMLWVSLPFQDNLILVYLSGVVAATLLEYVTGWSMERLFKVKYWDYSHQPFNLNGYICLSSSLTWGLLTIFLTELIHPFFAGLILRLSAPASILCCGILSVMFVCDTVWSVKEALNLARILEHMTRIRGELDDIQVQMALLRAEASQKMSAAREAAGLKAAAAKEEAQARAAAAREGAQARLAAAREEAGARLAAAKDAAVFKGPRPAELSRRLRELNQSRRALIGHVSRRGRNLLRSHPNASSPAFAEAFRELRELADRGWENSDTGSSDKS